VILAVQNFLTHVRKIETLSDVRIFCKKEKYRYKGKNPAGLEGKRRPISKWWRKKKDTRSPKKEKKVLAQKDGYKVVTSVVLRRNGGVFSVKIFTLR